MTNPTQNLHEFPGGLGLHLREDFRESARAFHEKRPPKFKGR